MPCCDAGCFIGHLFGLKTGLDPAAYHSPAHWPLATNRTCMGIYSKENTTLTSIVNTGFYLPAPLLVMVVSTKGDKGAHPGTPEQHQPHRR